jgi:cardiolipin synthase (CMP-forming)
VKKINLSRFTLKIFTTLPPSEKRITIATVLTISRIILVPIIVIAMVNSCWGLAFFLFVFARLLREKTFLGAFLDPIADKLLLISCFATLAFISTPLFTVPYWFVCFVMFKEIIQCIGAVIIYHQRGYLDIKPTLLGKITTATQMIFIIWLFSCYFFCWMPIKTYYTMFSIMTVLISAAFIQYIWIGLNNFIKLK